MVRPPRSAIATLLLLLACGDDAATDPPADGSADADSAFDAGPLDPCDVLFGSPNERTGLGEDRCRPTCACGGERFEPRAWDAAALASLRAFVDTSPPEELPQAPYTETPMPPPEGTVCGVLVEDASAHTYHVATYSSRDEAERAGAIPTHEGACGLCSTLVDLAVYAGTPDLTAPVRACGIAHLGDFEALTACLEELGFTRPCAQIWAYNSEHTREACGAVCLRLLNAPYHTPDGALNECLACDETESGPVFKAVAGRTRRNSGLANAMCRPCNEVVRFGHAYPGL